MEELIAWTGEPALLPRVTFGQHRGCGWDEVPPDYLAWIVDRSELGEDIKYTARQERGGRSENARHGLRRGEGGRRAAGKAILARISHGRR